MFPVPGMAKTPFLGLEVTKEFELIVLQSLITELTKVVFFFLEDWENTKNKKHQIVDKSILLAKCSSTINLGLVEHVGIHVHLTVMN